MAPPPHKRRRPKYPVVSRLQVTRLELTGPADLDLRTWVIDAFVRSESADSTSDRPVWLIDRDPRKPYRDPRDIHVVVVSVLRHPQCPVRNVVRSIPEFSPSSVSDPHPVVPLRVALELFERLTIS